jgi:hypothetical protein
MKTYSAERKEALVRRMMPPENALAQLSLFALRRDGFSPISDTAAAVTR